MADSSKGNRINGIISFILGLLFGTYVGDLLSKWALSYPMFSWMAVTAEIGNSQPISLLLPIMTLQFSVRFRISLAIVLGLVVGFYIFIVIKRMIDKI